MLEAETVDGHSRDFAIRGRGLGANVTGRVWSPETDEPLPLTDGFATNIWALSTSGSGEMRQLTDFGQRPTFIARRVSWSADGRSILAAVGEGDADIVLFEMK